MAFVLLNTLGKSSPDLCILDHFFQGIEIKSYMVCFGERLGDLYPKDARIQMTESRTGLKLSSLLGNTKNILMVSKELRAVIEKVCANVEIEYLPFTIIDHRGRPFSRDYCVVNPIGALDCLDHKASKTEWGTEDPTDIVSVEEYILDRKKVNGAPPLFRIEGDPCELVLGQPLLDEIKGKGFTNIFGSKLNFSDGKE
jgi:hypothetical protein